jgi:hypothetical protein
MVTVDLDSLLAAVAALGRAGYRDLVADLVASAGTDDPVDRAQLALAAGRVAADNAFWSLDVPEPDLEPIADAVAAAPGLAAAGWDLDLLRLRARYAQALFKDGPREGLADEAERLLGTAPDDGRRGWAAFHAGVIADNITGDRATARVRYHEALEAGDDLLTSYALRHLADHADEPATAWDLAWRSAELREKVGFVPGAIAQRLMLVDLMRAAGDEAGAAVLARDLARAAGARGWTRLAAAAAGER